MPANGLPMILERIGSHPGFRRLQAVLQPIAKHPIWWIVDQPTPRRLNYTDACKTCRFVRQSLAQRRVCQRQFLKVMDRARTTKRPQAFRCPIHRPAFVIPTIQDHQVTGYVATCHSEGPYPEASVQMAALAVESVVRELEKERELTNLYESIQPRCVALSTIHTINRLISSTLDFDELIPRLARLCVQVLRARRCSIMLVDEPRRLLIPKAVVDLKVQHPVERSL